MDIVDAVATDRKQVMLAVANLRAVLTLLPILLLRYGMHGGTALARDVACFCRMDASDLTFMSHRCMAALQHALGTHPGHQPEPHRRGGLRASFAGGAFARV